MAATTACYLHHSRCLQGRPPLPARSPPHRRRPLCRTRRQPHGAGAAGGGVPCDHPGQPRQLLPKGGGPAAGAGGRQGGQHDLHPGAMGRWQGLVARGGGWVVVERQGSAEKCAWAPNLAPPPLSPRRATCATWRTWRPCLRATREGGLGAGGRVWGCVPAPAQRGGPAPFASTPACLPAPAPILMPSCPPPHLPPTPPQL